MTDMNQAGAFAADYNADPRPNVDRPPAAPQAAALAAGGTWDDASRAYRFPDGSMGRFASDTTAPLPRSVFVPVDSDDVQYARLVERMRPIDGELHVAGVGYDRVTLSGGDSPTVTGTAGRVYGPGVLAGATVVVALEDVAEARRRLPGVAVEGWDTP